MVSASAWRPPAVAGWWHGGGRKVASASRLDAGLERWVAHGQGEGSERLRLARDHPQAALAVSARSQGRSMRHLGLRPGGQGAQRGGAPAGWGAAVRLHRRAGGRQGGRAQSHPAAPQGRGEGCRPRTRQGRIRLCLDRSPSGAYLALCRAGGRARQGVCARASRARARALRRTARRQTEGAEGPMQQDQDNQKNLLLAIVLSVGVLLAWQAFYAGPKLRDDQERRQRVQQELSQGKEQVGSPAAPGSATQPGAAVPSAAPLAAAATRGAALETSPRVPIETPS